MKFANLVAALAVGTMITAPISTQAQDESLGTFEMSGPWSLEYGDDYCQLAANFSKGEDEIALAMERNQAENQVRLILVSDAIRTFRAAEEIGYRFMPNDSDRRARYIKSETPDGRAYFNLGTIWIGPDPMAMFNSGDGAQGAGPPPPSDGAAPTEFVLPPYSREFEAEYARNVTGIRFSEGLLAGFVIDTGSLRGPIRALQGCMDDLLREWGLDHEKHQTMSRRAVPAEPAYEWIPRNVVGWQDFGLFGGARNPFRVMIDAEGNPTSCHVHWQSLSDRQNEQICDGIMGNGRFTPALDAAGQPMASYWTVNYVFGLNRPFGS